MQHLIRMHLGALVLTVTSSEPQSQYGSPLSSPLALSPVIKTSCHYLEGSLLTLLAGTSDFRNVAWRWALNQLVLTISGACIHEPHKSTNEKEDFNQAQEQYLPLCPMTIHLGSAQSERAKMAIFPFFSWKWFNFIVSQLLPESLASHQVLTTILFFGMLHHLLGANKEQRKQLRQPQRLKGNPKFGFGWLTSLICMRSVCQDW